MPDAREEHSYGSSVWIFHAGALGDFVLTWPLIRAIARSGKRASVVAERSKGLLLRHVMADEGLGDAVEVLDCEQPRFNGLWRNSTGAGGDPRLIATGQVGPEAGVSHVLSFVADESTPAGRRWLAAAEAMFAGAQVTPIGPPGSRSRYHAWQAWRVAELGTCPDRSRRGGPAVVHVGAGSPSKRWPMERWAQLREVLAQRAGGSREVLAIAGEVEREQFDGEEQRLFASVGGAWLGTLAELHARTRAASIFVGSDSGPAHLAAQLGVATVALFGPTDPWVWTPVGPRVRVVAPGEATGDMRWLEVERVAREVDGMME